MEADVSAGRRSRLLLRSLPGGWVRCLAGLSLAWAGASWGQAQETGPRNCFWQAQGDPVLLNVAYPDFAASYWLSAYTLPAGAELELRGRYPHARYMSFNLYDAGLAPVDGLADLGIAADGGSVNPFRAGARRDLEQRDYTVRVVPAPAPALRAANTLYQTLDGTLTLAPVTGSETPSPLGVMIYRIYLPDRGRSLTGDVPLPTVAVKLANGQRIEGPAACELLGTHLPDPVSPLLHALTPPASPTPGQNAADPVHWIKFTNLVRSAGVEPPAVAAPFFPPGSGGFFSNSDNAYVRAAWNTYFGENLLLFGRAPSFPDTRGGAAVMAASQVRYWSICQNDSTTTRTVSCLADDEVPLDAQGHYLVLIAGADARPANATVDCGVAYLPAGPNPRGFLLLRNMLPAAGFAQSVQAVPDADVETPEQAMGAYLPMGKHLSRAQFESLGCPVRAKAVLALLEASPVTVPPALVASVDGGASGGAASLCVLIVLAFAARTRRVQRPQRLASNSSREQ